MAKRNYVRELSINGKRLVPDAVPSLNNISSKYAPEAFEDSNLSYKLTPENEVSGFGKMFSTSAAKALISPHWNSLTNDDKSVEQIVATEIGREMLLLILSQRGCEGIRFYKAKRLCDCGEIEADENADTVVAIGIDQYGNDLGVAEYMGKKGDVNNPLSIMNLPADGLKNMSVSFCSECSPPPYTRKLKEVKERINNKEIGEEGLLNAFIRVQDSKK